MTSGHRMKSSQDLFVDRIKSWRFLAFTPRSGGLGRIFGHSPIGDFAHNRRSLTSGFAPRF